MPLLEIYFTAFYVGRSWVVGIIRHWRHKGALQFETDHEGREERERQAEEEEEEREEQSKQVCIYMKP